MNKRRVYVLLDVTANKGYDNDDPADGLTELQMCKMLAKRLGYVLTKKAPAAPKAANIVKQKE